MIQTTTRNAGLDDLVDLLKEQDARKIDMVVPASKIEAREGDLVIKGADPVLGDDGVTLTDGVYRPTKVCDEGIAAKLGIPLAYVRRLRDERVDLYDDNVNGLLHGRRPKVAFDGKDEHGNPKWKHVRNAIPGDDRKFMLRCFRGDEGERGIARALLSDQYAPADNLDVLMATLEGVQAAGVQAVIDQCDLTDRRMVVKIVAPEVQVLAERLLKGYRNPFQDEQFNRWREVADREGLGYGGEEPIIYAGLKISNSEVGEGAFRIVPEAKVRVCRNGLVLTQQVVKSTHLGSKLDEGVVRWSDDTQRKNLELIKAKTADAVKTFLDVDFVEQAVRALEVKASAKIASVDEVRDITKRAKFTEGQIDGIVEFFSRGGQWTRGGVMQAVTAYSQTVDDADAAYDMEGKAPAVLTA